MHKKGAETWQNKNHNICPLFVRYFNLKTLKQA
jgi:hypothetical protein